MSLKNSFAILEIYNNVVGSRSPLSRLPPARPPAGHPGRQAPAH